MDKTVLQSRAGALQLSADQGIMRGTASHSPFIDSTGQPP
jgi:hypothetical protein